MCVLFRNVREKPYVLVERGHFGLGDLFWKLAGGGVE